MYVVKPKRTKFTVSWQQIKSGFFRYSILLLILCPLSALVAFSDHPINITDRHDQGMLLLGIAGLVVLVLRWPWRYSAEGLSKPMLRVLDAVPEGVFIKRLDGHYTHCNAALPKMLNCSRKQVIDALDRDLFPAHQVALFQLHDSEVVSTRQVVRRSLRLTPKFGKPFWVELSKSPVLDEDGQISSIIGVIRDVTEERKTEEHIRWLAYFDRLTGLRNREGIIEILNNLRHTLRSQNRYAAVVLIDIEKFQNINNVFGYEVGDQLLRDVTERLKGFLHPQDRIARIGIDEFLVVSTYINGTPAQLKAEHGQKLLELRQLMNKPFIQKAGPVMINAHFGAVIYDGHREPDQVLREVDIAMNHDRNQQKPESVFWYTRCMMEEIEHSYQLETELYQALTNGEFELYLQPQIGDFEDSEHYEVLVRWRHPERGIVPPMEFIPIAERTGLIVDIGLWVLRQSIKLLSLHPQLHLAVNVSARQFFHRDFVRRVQLKLEKHQVEGKRLTLELTESLMVTDFEQLAERLNCLRNLGINLSIDDFGTGYSSVIYLKRLPFTELKIDKVFVDGLPTDESNLSLVNMILSMSRHLGMQVVAEGVETVEQLECLKELGCDMFQGYYFGKPQPSAHYLERS